MRLPLATAVMTVFVTASVSSSCSGYPPIREALSNSWAGLSVERRSKLSPVVFHGLAVETYPPVTDKAPSVGFYYSAQFWLISVYKAARELAAFFGTGPPVNGVYDIRDRRVNVTGFYRPNATATPHCWVPVTSQKYYVIFAELVNGELTAKDDATRGATADWTELNEGRVWKGAEEFALTVEIRHLPEFLLGVLPDEKDATIKIRCPCNRKIEVLKARYGLYREEGCALTESATLLVKTLCDSRRECLVSPEKRLFGDPCPGRTKSLAVEWVCTNAPGLRVERFEDGGEMKLSCPGRKYLKIHKAFYGSEMLGCTYALVQRKVEEKCNDKSSCSIKISKEFSYKKFSECNEFDKYLEVSYTCQEGTPISEQTCGRDSFIIL